MKKAAVIIDVWKLAIFSNRLVEAGYSYEQMSGPTAGTYLLQVEYEGMAKLHNVVKAANDECARKKGKK